MSRLNHSVLIVAAVLVSFAAFAKDEPARERGVLAEMQSVACGTMSKTGSSVAGVLITGSSHTQSTDMLCPEYILKAARVTYRIRPKDQKHPALLHVGDEAEFRLKKDKLLLRIPEVDNKEREYVVLAMIATSEFTSELNKKQHPPKPHGARLDVNADTSPDSPQAQPEPVASAPPAGHVIAAAAPTPAPAASPSAQPILSIASTPAGADIFLDSASVGRTPATLTVTPGQHTLQIVAPGYKDWVNTVSVMPGSKQNIDVALFK